MTRMKKLAPRRGREREVLAGDENDGDDSEAITEDDCPVTTDGDGGELENDDNGGELEDGNNGVAVEEEVVEELADHFGEIAREDESDEDSGDDIRNAANIPDPLSSDDEEEEARRESHEDTTSPDEILALGKTFGSASEFKQALLRYSLKTRYDIKLFLSSQKKLGAICSDKEDNCAWRVYCSYEKSKHKLQIKTYMALSENYCNFGVFELYGDCALGDALDIALKMTLAIPLADILAYRKLTKAYFGFVEVLCDSHITFILKLDTATFMHLVGSLESGLKGLDTSISSQCAIAVDNLASYYFNNITMGEAPTSPAAIRFAQHIADCPSLFPEILKTLFEIVLFESMESQQADAKLNSYK